MKYKGPSGRPSTVGDDQADHADDDDAHAVTRSAVQFISMTEDE